VEFFEEKYESRFCEELVRRKSERFVLKESRSSFSAGFSAACSTPDGAFLLREDRSNRHGSEGMGPILSTLADDVRTFSTAERGFPKGKTSVLFSPAVVSSLLSRITPWFFADRVRQKRSPLLGQDPKHLFSPVLGLVDAGNHPESPHSGGFDLEGTLTRESTLVERGALRNLLFDTYEAARENRLSTGSWLRSPASLWPSIQVSTAYFKPADQGQEALLREAGNGAWLRRVESLELEAEGGSRFRLVGCGNLIENGKPGPARRDIFLQFDAFELFRKAVAVGGDLTLFGNHGSPSILFEKVPLGDL
jgi:predicted Zn-dependent protease